MTTRPCPICPTGFTPIRRQQFCRPACRQTAHRRAHQSATPQPPLAAGCPRRDTTIYQCGDCEQRYLGQQWCHDCNRPCTRIGPGAPCPHCEEPVAIEDLIPAPQAQPRRPAESPQPSVDTGSETRDAR